MTATAARAWGPQAASATGPVAWLRQNLFNTWYNGLLTLGIGWLAVQGLWRLLVWTVTVADWTPVSTNLFLFLVGQYPAEHLWRVGVALWLVSLLFGLSWGVWGGVIRTFAVGLLVACGVLALLPLAAGELGLRMRLALGAASAVVLAGYGLGLTRLAHSRWLLLGWLVSPFLIYILLEGVEAAGLPLVSSTVWGGLLLNLLLAMIGIVASFPLGVLLALGRRSRLPVVSLLCTLFIELVRGVPLVSILFMASIMLPLFLPEAVRFERVARALVGITLFSAAYMAENVRGGLQAIPEGQVEAAKALGLNGPHTLGLIVLPQALRKVIPAIVGQFISLFKDTSLVVIVGLTDIVGIGKSVILGNPQWVGRQAEVYLFIAAVFWIFTYAMSHGSRRLEKALGVGQR